MYLGSTQPLTEMSTRFISWGKGGHCVKLTTLPQFCAVVMKSENHKFLEPSGPFQACNGTAYFSTVNCVVFISLRRHLPNEVFFLIFSAKISLPCSPMHVRFIVTSHNVFPIILHVFVDLLITKLPIILFHPVLLTLLLFTSRYPPSNIISQRQAVSLGLSVCGTNLTLIRKAATYYLNTCSSCTVGLEKERILISLHKVVFGWAVRVAVVELSPGLLWTTSILFCMYLLSVTVCAAIYRLD